MLMLDDLIRRETDLTLAAAARVPVQTPLVTPWQSHETVGEMAHFLAYGHWYWATLIAGDVRTQEGAEEVELLVQDRQLEREADAGASYDPRDDLRAATADLLAVLARTPDDARLWTYLPGHEDAATVRLMLMTDATVARWSAEETAGVSSSPVSAEQAAALIQDHLVLRQAWQSGVEGWQFRPGATVSLRATDADRHWVFQLGAWCIEEKTGSVGRLFGRPATTLTVERVGARLDAGSRPVAEVSGGAEELARWLWQRGPEPRTRHGDAAALEELRAFRDDTVL